MRLLIDANVILDVLQQREPHYKDSSLVWKICETGQADGYISVLTIANLVYVMRKELDPEQVKDVIQKLKLIFQLADFSVTDLGKASEMKWSDFEDAIQSATAERIQADYIITRNVKDFTKSKVAAFTPSELITRL